MAIISIAGLDKAEVLARLFNAAAEHNPDMRQARRAVDPRARLIMPIHLARELIDSGMLQFDYLSAIPLKLDLRGEEFDDELYDRDNGKGLAKRVIDTIRRRNKAPFN